MINLCCYGFTCCIFCTCVRFCNFKRITFRQIAYINQRAKRFTIVDSRNLTRLHCNLAVKFGYSQYTDGLADGIVAFYSCAVPHQTVSVIGGADCCLGPGCLECCGFVVHKSVDGAVGCKLFTVIDSRCLRRVDGQRRRCNGDGGRILINLQIIGYIYAFRVPDDQLVRCDFNFSFSHIGHSRAGRRFHQRVSRRQFAHLHRRAVRLSIIGEGSACCRHHDLIGVLADCQGSDGLVNSVVAFLGCRVLPVNLVGVLGRAHDGLGSGHGEGRCLFSCESINRAGCSQRRSVVCLAG